ncbi:MAG: hypothetical protein Q7S22_00330 [Candidatus Micrarchaeota archaeon]|nr:hypothetical protein [Candidatus Micrarchaeota archaeon]
MKRLHKLLNPTNPAQLRRRFVAELRRARIHPETLRTLVTSAARATNGFSIVRDEMQMINMVEIAKMAAPELQRFDVHMDRVFPATRRKV